MHQHKSNQIKYVFVVQLRTAVGQSAAHKNKTTNNSNSRTKEITNII